MTTKLIYFHITARGEPIRFLLHYGAVQFEDERLDKEQFLTRKQEFPFGMLPVLEIDGLKLHQMIVICRYLGRKFGLTGKTERDALECDMLAGSIDDCRQQILNYYFETHPEAREQKKEVITPKVEFFLKRFDQIIQENGGYFVNGQLTWVDFLFAGQAENLNFFMDRDLYAELPHLRALINKVRDLPAVKTYIATRPTTKF